MALEPIDPETALELYLTDRESEVSQATLYSHRSRLGHFVRWCEKTGIQNLNELTGRQLQEYRLWRREDGDLAPISEQTQMDTLRVFIRWLESMDGVEQDLSTKVVSPSLDANQSTRDVMLEADRASFILAYLEKYHYASLEHVSLLLMWHTMMRIGAVRALDVRDYDSKERFVEVHHRPESGTPIKNKKDGERMIALSEQVCDVIDDWLAEQRPPLTDSYDREPLLTTTKGRVSKGTIRTNTYLWTQPCRYGVDCPHGRDPTDCEARERDLASRCPSSVSPHAIRRGGITHSLTEGMPDKVVSDRANVTQAVLEDHYDRRTKREKMEQRREYLNTI